LVTLGDFRAFDRLTSVTGDRFCGYCVCWDGDGMSWVFWPPGGFRHIDQSPAEGTL